MYQTKRSPTFDEFLMLGTKKRPTILNENKNEMTRIEYLSNELFYEIFEYLHGIDIYRAFFNLNSRFQHLLTGSLIPLKIKLNSAVETELSHHCDNMIKPNKHHILSLYLENHLLIKNFFTFCPIDSSFDRLESVVLNGILSDTSILALFHLKSLSRLFSLTMDFHMVEGNYFDDIYQIIFSFSYLKYNKLSISSNLANELFMNPFASVVFNKQCSTIEYLIINHSCTIDELLFILNYVPHLRHLSCQNLRESLNDIDSIQPIMLPNLIHISIINPSITFFEFEILIMKLLTMIQILKIDLFDDITYLNTHRWEKLIIKHMPQLRKLYLTYRQSEIDLEDISLSTLANQFTSSFWIERQWFLECMIDCTGIHYSIRPDRNAYLDIYKHTQIADYFNHNIHSNSAHQIVSIIQLRIDELSDNESHQVFLDRLKTTFIDAPFTHLIINCRNIPIGFLVRIIYLLPNLDSLQVSISSLISPNWLFDDDDKEIRFITSFKNKITKVNLGKIIDIEQIHFILHLCPSIQYLQIDIPTTIDLNILIRFILIKSSTYTPYLCSLCLSIPNADNKIVNQIEKLIESERLIINYKIERICNHILLKWN